MFHSSLGGGLGLEVVVVVVVLVGVGDGGGGGGGCWVVVLLLGDVQYTLNTAVCPGLTVCGSGEFTVHTTPAHSLEPTESVRVSEPLTAKLPELLPVP
jgi:hypothetical protein